MNEKNDQAALRNLHVNTSKVVVNNTCAPPIWSHLQESVSLEFKGQIPTNEQCEVNFSDTTQQKPRDPLGEITVIFAEPGCLPEIQKLYSNR